MSRIGLRFATLRAACWIAATLALVPCRAFGDSFFVQETSGVGVADSDLKTTTELIRNAVTQAGDHELATDPLAADYVLRPKLLRLGNAYLVALEKQHRGKAVYSSQIKTTRMEDLDTAAVRLVQSVIDEVPTEDTRKVGETVSGETTQGDNRRQAVRQWYLGFGPTVASNLGNAGLLLNFHGAYAWDLDTNALNLFLDGAWSGNGSGASFWTLGLGMDHFFKRTDISPFVGASFGYGSAGRLDLLNTQMVSGFVLAVEGGYQFFRTSTVCFEVAGRYQLMLQSNSQGLPQLFGLRLGIYFHL